MDNSELPRELNLSVLQEQYVVLTPETSLQLLLRNILLTNLANNLSQYTEITEGMSYMNMFVDLPRYVDVSLSPQFEDCPLLVAYLH